MQPLTFQAPPHTLRVAAGEVHVWRVPIDRLVPAMQDVLSADEWIRAERFHFDEHRRHYIAAHCSLRMILGAYLGQSPETLVFDLGPHGKPALAGHLLRFNLSHSGPLMLLAVTHGREVGIDMEAIREAPDIEGLAEHYFSPEDQWELRTLPIEERPHRFFEIWTRTEALLKARGCGLSGLTEPPTAEGYSLRSIEIDSAHVATLAVEGNGFDLRCFLWGPPQSQEIGKIVKY